MERKPVNRHEFFYERASASRNSSVPRALTPLYSRGVFASAFSLGFFCLAFVLAGLSLKEGGVSLALLGPMRTGEQGPMRTEPVSGCVSVEEFTISREQMSQEQEDGNSWYHGVRTWGTGRSWCWPVVAAIVLACWQPDH